MQWGVLLSVGIGGFIGAVSRFLLAGWVQKVTHSAFPFGTLSVNIIGSFFIGFLFFYVQQENFPTALKLFLVTGLLGALTTFSTFSLETLVLFQQQMWVKVGCNILLNVGLSLLATLFGMFVFKKVFGI